MKLAELFRHLDRCERDVPLDELCARLGELEIGDRELQPHVRFDDAGYTRNLVHLGPGYAALVLCWQPGQASPVHDHRGSACALRVLAGVASERRYAREPDGRLVETSTSTYETGQVCGTYDADIHTMFNAGRPGADLVTLHVYTPPMLRYYAYALDAPEVRVCRDEEVWREQQRRLLVDPSPVENPTR